MSKSEYLALLMRQPLDWVIGSMKDPSPHMTKTDLALHAIAIRRRNRASQPMRYLDAYDYTDRTAVSTDCASVQK